MVLARVFVARIGASTEKRLAGRFAMVSAAGAGVHDIVSRHPAFQEMSRAQLIQKSVAGVSPVEIRDRVLPGWSVAQCRAALATDLGVSAREPRQRVALCRKHLAAHPGDAISSAGICAHFALAPEEALSALTALERGVFQPDVRLRPLYPGSEWEPGRETVEVDLRLEGSYWHPLEVMHLHAVSRGVLPAREIHDRRIFPGAGLRDLEHHLHQVRLPDPGQYRIRSREKQGQLTAGGRALLLAYLRYLKQARQFVTFAAIADLFDISSTLMSALAAESGWDRASYYAFRKATYRELVSRYVVRLAGAEGVRASDVAVAAHAARRWRFSADMIHRNLLPQAPVERIAELTNVALPLVKLSGVGSQFEWFHKIPSRKLLFDVMRDHFGVMPRWELARLFRLTENCFREIFSSEGLDTDGWDAAWREKREQFVFCLPALDPLQSADCLHVQMLKRGGIAAADVAELQLVDEPLETLTGYLGVRTGLQRAKLPPPKRDSRELDLLTHCALRSYLRFYAGEAEQSLVEDYFGIGPSVLRKARRSMAAGPASLERWSRQRNELARNHFGSLRRLFGRETGQAVALLHLAVTAQATGAPLPSVAAALDMYGGSATTAAATRLAERMKSPKASRQAVKALLRHYLAEHPGVPLGPLSGVTGVTPRILSNLRPPRDKPAAVRDDWWKETFKQSADFKVWSTLRTEAGLPRNGWRQ
jgi:hypothetical protein